MPIHNKPVDDFWRDKVSEIANNSGSINTNISNINNNTEIQSIQSTVNTTITPLGSGSTFTGTFEQNNYSDVGVSCQTDNSGTLFFDFSPNGIDVNTFPVAGFQVAAGIHEFHTAVKLGRYFRIRLVNDTGAQTYLRLYTYYGTFRQGNLPLGSTVNDDSDCIIVREPYNPIDIARGNIQSVESFSKFGENSAVGTTTVPVASAGVYRTPTSATALELVSSSANDTNSGGSGARKVTVIGLDANWLEVSQEINMNGTSTVALGTNLIRAYRLFVSDSGTYANATAGSHVGTITLREAGAGATWATIPLINSFPVGQSLIGAYTVPAGKTLFIENIELSSNTAKTASVSLFKRDNADDVVSGYSGIIKIIRLFAQIEGTISLNVKGLDTIPEKTDVGFMSWTSASTADVSVSFNGYLIDI